MENKLRYIHVMACSNLGTRIRLTLSEETDDLRHLISMALLKLDSFNTASETYRIEHIDSISELRGIDV
jgi:hypothetical protein